MSTTPIAGMGRNDREETSRDGVKSESNVDPDDDGGPMDLSMPRYPNRKTETRATSSYFAAARRKPPSSSYEVDANEQPIDYSKKYVESNTLSTAKTNYVPRNSLNKVKIDHRERDKGFTQQDNKAYPYGVYAETDLDQPTDYSLRYAEDDTDDEEKQNSSYFNGNEQEDTVKTYCTEGTPYETPFNVSSATSMSDLRLEDTKDGEAGASKRAGRKIIQDSRGDPNTKQPPPMREEQENEDAKPEENEILSKESKNISNELVLNSSTVSIEKPVNYYDEGTPGRMSRVSSLSSLGCANDPTNEDPEEAPEHQETQTTPALPVSPIPLAVGCDGEIEDAENSAAVVTREINDAEAVTGSPDEDKVDARVVDKEGKVVTFGGEDHYAEQTPLMFSRSSSLGSLSGFEQQSIHDDRSSIVSDFSRRTSGVVSPSELPDSPTQTVPPSPRHHQKSNVNDLSPRAPPLRHFSYVKSPRAKSSVFEDNVTAFKEESTPLEFSAATSLSSLTIDDEPKILMDAKEKDYTEETHTVESFFAQNMVDVSPSVEIENGNDNAGEEVTRLRETVGRSQEHGSDGDEDDEDILAACISMGMRNSMYKQSCNKVTEIPDNVGNRISNGDSATNLVRYETSSTLDRLAADVAAVSSSPIAKGKAGVIAVPTDTLRIYCTEDTPANISPVGSQSNLSALSILSISGDIEKEDLGRASDEDDDDKILDDCIRAGIARTLQGTNSFPGTAVTTEFNSPSRASSMKKCQEDGKASDVCTSSGIVKNSSGSNSFPGTAAATKHSSPRHALPTKKSELYMPRLPDSAETFSTSPSASIQSEDLSALDTSVLRSHLAIEDTSGCDDKVSDGHIEDDVAGTMHESNSSLGTAASTCFSSPTHGSEMKEGHSDEVLEDCIRIEASKYLQGSNSFPGTAVATKHHSPYHVPSLKKSEDQLPNQIDSRQAFTVITPAVGATNDVSRSHESSTMSNSTVADHDASVDDDKILDDCIRAGIARTLGGTITFPSNANATKHHSPRHAASSKNTKVYVLGSIDNCETNATSKLSSAEGKLHSANFDQNTSVDEDMILEECIRAGMARTMHGANSFPGTAAATGFNTPTHGSSTKECQSDKIPEDCMRAGIGTGLQGSNSFPGTAVATKHHSPHHVPSLKRSEVHLSSLVDSRQAFSKNSSTAARMNNASQCPVSSVASNSMIADHDTLGDDDNILDDCIRAGIARTLGGTVAFQASPTEPMVHVLGSADNRQIVAAPKSSLTKGKLHSANFDHDTSGDEDKILDECIRVGMARTMHGTNSFPGSTATTKLNSPRHTSATRAYHDGEKVPDDGLRLGVTRTPHGNNSFPGTPVATKHNSPRHTSTKKSEGYFSRPADGRPVFLAPPSLSARRNDVSASRVSSGQASLAPADFETSADEDKILDACIKAGIARTLQGVVSFPRAATHSPRHVATAKNSEVYSVKQAFSMPSPSPTKSNDSTARSVSTPRLNSTVHHHDTAGEDNTILEEYIQVGIARSLQGTVSFPYPAVVPKLHSPRHVTSAKKSELYLAKSIDTRQTFSIPATSTTQSNESSTLGTSSVRTNSTIGHLDSLADDDKILDECIKAGIARTLHGVVPFPSTTAATQPHSPRRVSATKNSEVYLSRTVGARQSLASLSPSRSNGIRRAPSPRSIVADQDCVAQEESANHSEDEVIVARCIESGVPKATTNSLSYTKSQGSRNIPKSMARSPNVHEAPACSSTRVTTEVFRTSVTTILIPATGRRDECFAENTSISDEEGDSILAQCIRSGMPGASSVPLKAVNYAPDERTRDP